jgi:hypothetical protein
MRGSWRRLLALALLLAIGALAGWLLGASTSAPQLLARALSGFLGRTVELDDVTFHVGQTFQVDISNLRILDAAGTEPIFQARRARGTQRWPSLLAGRVLPLTWTLERPHLVVTLAEGDARSGPPRLPPHNLTVQDGTLELRIPGEESIRVVDLHLSARRTALRPSVRGNAIGAVTRGDAPVARFQASFDGWIGDAHMQATLEDLDLAQLAFGGFRPPSGSARGLAQLSYREDALDASLSLDATGLRWALPNLRGPIAPAEFHLTADASWRDGALVVRPDPVRMDDLVVRGEIEIGTRRRGRVRAELEIDDFRPGLPNARLQLLRLVGLRHKSWRDADARTRAGWLRQIEMRVDLPREGFTSSLSFRSKLTPEELTVSGRLREGVYEPSPGHPPLEDISVDFLLAGNVLSLTDLLISRSGRPLPVMQVEIDGMHRVVHLPAEERRVPKGPGASIPGLAAAFAAMQREPGDERPEALVRLADLSVAYPGFVLPFRDGEAVLRFPDGNVLVEQADGIFGGAPARLRAFWDRPNDALSVEIEYGDGEAPPLREAVLPPEQSWFDGRVELETLYLGPWRLDGVTGDFHGDGPTIELRNVDARLGGGALAAKGYVSLAEEEKAPLGFVLDLTDADAAAIAQVLGMQSGTLRGTLDADGTLLGQLTPERPFLADARIRLDSTIRNGTLGNTPRTVALARLATPMGWTGLFGRRLPYDQITGDFEVSGGQLRVRDFALTGPELRALAAGTIDLLSDDLHTDMVVALLFLQTVDTMLERVPLFGSWVLGRDKNLIALYFQLEGPWENPSGRVVTPGAIQTATGWAGRLLGGGVRRIRDLLRVGRASPEDGAGNGASQGQGR